VKRSRLWIAGCLSAIVIVFSIVYWWRAAGRETIMQWLRPRFQVMAIDAAGGTMVLRQWNRTYTVKCERRCNEFAAGKSYSASDRGSDLEIKVAGHVVRCPIIKIEVRFDTNPGGLGSYVSLAGTLRRSVQKHSGRVPY
jgi:hypothetical protein